MGHLSLIPRPCPNNWKRAWSHLQKFPYVLSQQCSFGVDNFVCLISSIAGTKHKLSLLSSTVMHRRHDHMWFCAMDHMVGYPKPSPSVLAYCKQSKTGGGIEGLGMRLIILSSCKPQKARWWGGWLRTRGRTRPWDTFWWSQDHWGHFD